MALTPHFYIQLTTLKKSIVELKNVILMFINNRSMFNIGVAYKKT